MNAFLTFSYLLLCAVIVIFVPSLVTPYTEEYGIVTPVDMGKAVLLCTALALPTGLYIYRRKIEGLFLVRLFIIGLMVRMIVGTTIFSFNGQGFFGGDALTYDFFGYAQLQGWLGDKYMQSVANIFTGEGRGSGWGMIYLVAAVYGLIGRNPLAIQLINAVLGATTAPIIYLCAHHVFNNLRVARYASIAVAFYPSLVLWSSQGLKDGPIVFCLAVSILATLKLGQKLSVKHLVALGSALLALLTLRFYIFYILCAATVAAFVIGMQSLTAKSFARQFVVMIALGLAFTYFGVAQRASMQLEFFGNLERLQITRLDQAQRAESGFGEDVDVSTTEGALSTVPMGLTYLLFAPFPWQITSLRQSITLPEMVIWWASFPLLILGFWYAIRYRLRMMSPILIFTVMLTLAYSIFQGDVGTAYRQRSQLLVFYFIFVAVGFVLLKEKRDERKRQESIKQRELASHQGIAFGARHSRVAK